MRNSQEVAFLKGVTGSCRRGLHYGEILMIFGSLLIMQVCEPAAGSVAGERSKSLMKCF
jgi:hypothetical protein